MKTSQNTVGLVFLTFSFFGLALTAALVNLSTGIVQQDVFWRKPLVGSVFAVVCILGILAGIFPSTCSTMFHFKRTGQNKPVSRPERKPTKELAVRGHHPDCGDFSPHVFRIGNKVLCAGCMGLILGAIVSLLGVVLYFSMDMWISVNYALVFWVGFVLVSCGLLQYQLFNWGKGSIHLLVNVFFVFGVFLLLMGVDAISQSVAAGLYVVALSVFWLYTRILLSQRDHREICLNCPTENCEFFKKH